MKKIILLIILLISSSTLILAQSAKDELENGHRLKAAEKLFLHFSEDGKMKISVDETFSNPLTFPDSTLFIIPNVGVNVYMRPMNPLKGTTNYDVNVIDDPAIEAAEESLSALVTVINNFASLSDYLKLSQDNNASWLLDSLNEKSLSQSQRDALELLQKELFQEYAAVDSNTVFIEAFKKQSSTLKGYVESINNKIKEKRHQKVNDLFKELLELDFKHKEKTLNSLKKIGDSLEEVKKHYSEIDKEIKKARSNENSLMVPMNYISALLLAEVEEVKNGEYKIVMKFEELFKMVNTYAQSAANGADGVDWIISLGEISVKKGKISTFSIELKSGKYKFDEEKISITEVSHNTLGKHSIKVKKFQRFVPEVAYGTAYTFIEYPVYGTTEDENGNQVVVQSGNERINNLNISGMINFNYYLPNSYIHPLIQIGLGINNEIPTLLAGGGIRISINDTRFAITGGMALTWVKKLNELSEGDIVSGTADIDEDLTFQFNWPPKPYVGLQFKF